MPNDEEKLPPLTDDYFESIYGPYVPGVYWRGNLVRYRDPGDVSGEMKMGTVLWSFGPGRNPTYVLNDGETDFNIVPKDNVKSKVWELSPVG
jgi:hypothetical protein